MLHMAPERATQIQTALIKAGYMTGSPTGTWDAATQDAMEKMQADNGWQTKLIPDSRAIIKLGLGSNAGSAAAIAPVLSEDPEVPSVAPETSLPAQDKH
jgi:peptidoglycan hydrolase-like protein with peptidoglycan-binding domain